MNKQTRDLMFSSKSVKWSTPKDFFAAQDAIHHFDIDVCATSRDTKCVKFISPRMDAFKTPWTIDFTPSGTPARCWMNPPYCRSEHPCKNSKKCKKKACKERGYHCKRYQPGLEDWLELAYSWSLKGCRVVCLLPSRTDVDWYHDICVKYGKVEHLRGRLKFSGKGSAPFPSMLVVFEAQAVSPARFDVTGISSFHSAHDTFTGKPVEVVGTACNAIYDKDTGWCVDCAGANGEHEPDCKFRRNTSVSVR